MLKSYFWSMNKKLFILLIVLMSLSLIGIIFVQGYWIKNTVENKEEHFSYNAKQILSRVASKVQRDELEEYYFALLEIIEKDTLGKPSSTKMSEIFKIEKDDKSNGTYIYSQGVLEEDYKVTSSFLNFETDTIRFKKLVNRRVTRLIKNNLLDSNEQDSETKVERIFRMGEFEKEFIKSAVLENAAKIPIQQRISEEYLENLISNELEKNELQTTFEFGIYRNGIATKLRSDNFELDFPSTYGVPLFIDDVGNSQYHLFVNFIGKKKVILSSITLMAALSIIFTLIIVIAYSSALSQLIKQRQISQIKTDFINNMTHEFKTPIATINLALDSMKNEKIKNDPNKVQRYLQMIRDENQRMNAHVENVLRISKLEKNELDLKKERLDLHELIYDAIAHVELIVEDRKGYIATHLNAESATIFANDNHFTNVVVNILDNAIKYTPEEKAPKIDIYTENHKNHVVLKIKDQGSGMSKTVQSKIFEKFYREHTGDIHNVKGHGLGLAYVKRIIDDHHGEISVQSEKEKGSIFIIKLPLIS